MQMKSLPAWEAANLVRPLALWICAGLTPDAAPMQENEAAAIRTLFDAVENDGFDSLRDAPDDIRACMATMLLQFIHAAEQEPGAIMAEMPAQAEETELMKAAVLAICRLRSPRTQSGH